MTAGHKKSLKSENAKKGVDEHEEALLPNHKGEDQHSTGDGVIHAARGVSLSGLKHNVLQIVFSPRGIRSLFQQQSWRGSEELITC